MKTKNTRVRLSDIKQGVTVYVANAITKGVTEHFITSRPYIEKSTKSLFVQSMKCHIGDGKYVVYDYSHLNEFSLEDAGIINNTYNKNRTFFKRKHAEEYLRRIENDSVKKFTVNKHGYWKLPNCEFDIDVSDYVKGYK